MFCSVVFAGQLEDVIEHWFLLQICSSSICNKIGWEQCYITETEGEKVNRSNMCFVACTSK